MTDGYTCAVCRQTFGKEWSDEDAYAEARTNFGDVDKSQLSAVCDDCYRQVAAANGLAVHDA